MLKTLNQIQIPQYSDVADHVRLAIGANHDVAETRLGREGREVAVFESSMEWERGCILASCLA